MVRSARLLGGTVAGALAVVCLGAWSSAGLHPTGRTELPCGVPVTKQAHESAAVAKNTSAETSLVAAIKKAIVAQGSVHLDVKGYQKGTKAAVETAAWDVGMTSANESITEGKGAVTIRVTPKAAYFSGNATGLTKIIGLSSAQTKKVGPRWVELKAGTSQYKGFAGAETFSALPDGVLPPSTTSVKLSSGTLDGGRVDVLTWRVAATGSTEALAEKLVVPATARPLPLTEVTSAGGDSRTNLFSKWGLRFPVPVPAPRSIIEYSKLVPS